MLTRFEALGTVVPAPTETTPALIDRMAFKPPFDVEAITGIRSRHVCGEEDDSLSLAIAAARDCLSRSRYAAADLDAVLSVSISRVRAPLRMCFEPSFALQIKRAIGARAALHFDVSNACAGMLTGVWLLDRMIRAGVIRRGMVVSGERITPIVDTAALEVRDARDPQFGSLTVGDSGAAVIVDAAEDENDCIHYIELMTCAEHSQLCLGMPSDQRGGVALYTNNHEMHRQERIQLWPRFQMDFLARRGTSFAEEKYDYIVHHQVGTTAVRLFSKFGGAIFGAEMPESLTCVETHGNTSTTSHFMVLRQHLKEGRVKKGAKFLLVPAASGVITGCVSATISSLRV
jgi:3-oxoacyl-[acyl-carrier-protein] synthase-3